MLAAADKYADAISAVFSEDGKLNVAFSQVDIITEAVPMMIDGVEQLVEQSNVSSKVDMKLLTYTPVHDIALLEEDGLFLKLLCMDPKIMRFLLQQVVAINPLQIVSNIKQI